MDEVEGTTPLKDCLFAALGKRIGEYGFARVPRNDFFVKSQDGITNFLFVICLEARAGYRVEPSLAVRIDSVEGYFSSDIWV
jgi:hypothetical protein